MERSVAVSEAVAAAAAAGTAARAAGSSFRSTAKAVGIEGPDLRIGCCGMSAAPGTSTGRRSARTA